MPRRIAAAIATALFITAAAPTTPVPLYDNLGDHHYAITTSSDSAQLYFDQGLRLYYAFNHAEAIRAFTEAARRDPDCAMCYWGTALAYGPNINAMMDSASGAKAYAALTRARAARGANARERALIRALGERYAAAPTTGRARLDSAYARAMKQVTERHPTDVEAMTLYAEALMDLSPWNYWRPDGSPRPHTPDVLEHLDRAIAIDPVHPGANHFYIHAVEAVDPARALPMAQRLAGLMPGAGHLVHMPGHIYVRVGRYLDAVKANEHAVHADETYIRDQQPGVSTYTAGYYPHNYDFLAFAASMLGRSRQSIEAAEKMASLASPEMLRAPGMTVLQYHLTRHLQLKVRFARWDDILATRPPPRDLPHASAMWAYTRGRALIARGDIASAEAELAHLRATARDSTVGHLRLEFNTLGAVLAIAAEVLAGHSGDGQGGPQARHQSPARGRRPRGRTRVRRAARVDGASATGPRGAPARGRSIRRRRASVSRRLEALPRKWLVALGARQESPRAREGRRGPRGRGAFPAGVGPLRHANLIRLIPRTPARRCPASGWRVPR